MDVITIEEACRRYDILTPKKLAGAIHQNLPNYPHGELVYKDGKLVGGVVQDDDHLKRYVIRLTKAAL